MYNYETQKKMFNTDEGFGLFIKMRDKAKELLKTSGCFRMDKLLNSFTGDTWSLMCCVDKMVEIGDIVEVKQDEVAGQHRIFRTP